jgi:carnitine 3-dehydrogenase
MSQVTPTPTPTPTPTTNVKRVAVVGTGVIGASWVAYFLAHGLDVNATDPSPGAEARLREAVAQHWPTLERFGLAEGASLDRLRFHDSLEDAVSVADFVQENGPERMDFKIDLFRRMDAAAPPDTLLASSSSGLAISGVQSGCAHPQRVVLGHPFNPPHLIPLVEVIGGEQTSADAIEHTMAFYAAIGKRPIHVKREVKGHIANRLQAALWREAFHLVNEGVASVADIDTAIAHGPGLRWAVMGPFMNLHLSGGTGRHRACARASGRADRRLVERPGCAVDDGRPQAEGDRGRGGRTGHTPHRRPGSRARHPAVRPDSRQV